VARCCWQFRSPTVPRHGQGAVFAEAEVSAAVESPQAVFAVRDLPAAASGRPMCLAEGFAAVTSAQASDDGAAGRGVAGLGAERAPDGEVAGQDVLAGEAAGPAIGRVGDWRQPGSAPWRLEPTTAVTIRMDTRATTRTAMARRRTVTTAIRCSNAC